MLLHPKKLNLNPGLEEKEWNVLLTLFWDHL